MGPNPTKTFLHAWHRANGANLVAFGDYEMPLWYGSAKNEHLAVITHAGMFDTSHMAAVMVRGNGARRLLQRCFTRDLDACIGKLAGPLINRRCVYGAFLDESGCCIDDAIIYQITPDQFMVVVNASMGAPVARHLLENVGADHADITDLSDALGKFDIQGPRSVDVLRQVINHPERVFDKLIYFSFKGHFDPQAPQAAEVQLRDGTPLLLSRSGYTGEVGFEIFIAPEHTVKAWEMILAAGASAGALACGLAARDSLRMGALLPLSHQDIGHWLYLNHPWRFALPYAADGRSFTKSFIGAEALLAADAAEYTLAFAGNDLRKVDSHGSRVLTADGKDIGAVLTCATDMAIGRFQGKIYSIADPDAPEGFKAKGLCGGFVKVNQNLAPGTPIILTDGKRKLKVLITDDIRPHRTARLPLNTFM